MLNKLSFTIVLCCTPIAAFWQFGTAKERLPSSLYANPKNTAKLKKALEENTYDIHAGDSRGLTPLLGALWAKNSEAAILLINYGANVDDTYAVHGMTALMYATHDGLTDVVKLLIDEGADVNASSKGTFTALMHAAIMGHTEIAKYLLDAGADINVKTLHGATTALDFARQHKKNEIIELLEKTNKKT